jgi:hypothetical protein
LVFKSSHGLFNTINCLFAREDKIIGLMSRCQEEGRNGWPMMDCQEELSEIDSKLVVQTIYLSTQVEQHIGFENPDRRWQLRGQG